MQLLLRDGCHDAIWGCCYFWLHHKQLRECPVVITGERVIGSSYWRFEDVLRKGTWLASCHQRYERTMVCSGRCAAVIWWIFLITRCPYIIMCGRGAGWLCAHSCSIRKVAGPSRHHSSPGKGKKKVPRSPVNMTHQFEVSSPSARSQKRAVVEDPTVVFALASQSPRVKARRSGRDRKAALVFQGGMPWLRLFYLGFRNCCTSLYFGDSLSSAEKNCFSFSSLYFFIYIVVK